MQGIYTCTLFGTNRDEDGEVLPAGGVPAEFFHGLKLKIAVPVLFLAAANFVKFPFWTESGNPINRFNRNMSSMDATKILFLLLFEELPWSGAIVKVDSKCILGEQWEIEKGDEKPN